MTEEFYQQRELPLEPSTIENIDLAVYGWLKDGMNIYTETNQGWRRTPVVWVSNERARNVKMSKELRDENGAVILPIITLKRNGFVKDMSKKGIYWAALPRSDDGGTIQTSKIIQQDKSSNFANADTKRHIGQLNYKRLNEKVVYEIRSTPLPTYIDVTYEILLKSEYQQQMNEMVTPFVTRPGGINYQNIQRDGHNYELFVQEEFTQNDNGDDLDDKERLFETKIEIKVLGYLVGEGKNLETPKVVRRENFVEVKIPRERVIVGDIKDLDGKKIF